MEEPVKWVNPEIKREAAQRANDRANAARWGLDVAIFLFAILIIVVILLFQEIEIEIVSPIAIFGLVMGWLVGWRRGRLLYPHFYEEELAKNREDWKDYYAILRVNPNAEPKTISAAYERLAHIYHDVLSDETKKIPLYSLMINETDEAYKVLSDPIKRTDYDHAFWLKYNAKNTDGNESDRNEIIDLAQSVADEVRNKRVEKGWASWRIPDWVRVPRPVIFGLVITFLAIFSGGTSLAFAEPEHTLATPFKGVAVALIKTSNGAIGLIEDVRGITAMHERQIVSTALQLMRLEENLKEVPVVVVPTNDMSNFPSHEHSLFPDYLETKNSEFRYTVDSKGIVSVDTSWATTDAFLDKLKLSLERLEEK